MLDHLRSSLLKPRNSIRTNFLVGTGLRWEHVDLRRRIAHLQDTNSNAARTVPLPTAAVDILRSLPHSVGGEVFSGVTSEAINRSFVRAVRRAGIEDLRFHDLRHEATSRFF